jgi:hypothetical protein
MTNGRLNNEKTERFQLLKVPPKFRFYKIDENAIYKENNVLPG